LGLTYLFLGSRQNALVFTRYIGCLRCRRPESSASHKAAFKVAPQCQSRDVVIGSFDNQPHLGRFNIDSASGGVIADDRR
jgi:hypothetical protein